MNMIDGRYLGLPDPYEKLPLLIFCTMIQIAMSATLVFPVPHSLPRTAALIGDMRRWEIS
ncbi:MAG: hypothetical protein B7X99_03515 [Rhizobiales bacterium 17-65-6]|nr:MAG: hypothetical protein B7X99_03515 [Rhizobiales bacterium 17-65-6]